MIEIEMSSEEIINAKLLLEKFSASEVNKAAASAINRTVTTVRKETSKLIKKSYTIGSSDIKTAINTQKATSTTLKGVVNATGRPISLTKFKVQARKTGPVRVQVRKSAGLRPVKGLFLGRSRASYAGLMQRITSKSYPLRVPYGPSVAQMLGSEDVIKSLTPIAEETLNARFAHEVAYRVSKLGGK